MALYSNMFVFLNGGLLAEHVTLETDLEGELPDVFTMAKNWSGVTPSPIKRTVTVTNALPLKGVEFDFEAKRLAFEEVELMMQEGGSGKKCVSKGYITACPRSSGAGQNTTISFSFSGTPSAFQ